MNALSPEELALGPNAWLVDEMRAKWTDSPTSVSESWQAYFATGNGSLSGPVRAVSPMVTIPSTALGNGSNGPIGPVAAAQATKPAEPASASAAPPPVVSAFAAAPSATVSTAVVAASAAVASRPVAPPPAVPAGGTAEPLRGVAAKIVMNMEASLHVPTATSVRDIPAKLLEVERNIVNRDLARTRGGRSASPT